MPRRSPFAPACAIQSRIEAIASRSCALSARSARSEALALSFAAVLPPPSQDGSAWPASVARAPASRGAVSRASTASSTWPVTVRPKRASHAAGISSVFSIVPVAAPSAIRAPAAFVSRSVTISAPSSWASSSTATRTVFAVSPAAKVSVPETAV